MKKYALHINKHSRMYFVSIWIFVTAFVLLMVAINSMYLPNIIGVMSERFRDSGNGDVDTLIALINRFWSNTTIVASIVMVLLGIWCTVGIYLCKLVAKIQS
jgi:hypothetical protein